jgi:hypothetical protein
LQNELNKRDSNGGKLAPTSRIIKLKLEHYLNGKELVEDKVNLELSGSPAKNYNENLNH